MNRGKLNNRWIPLIFLIAAILALAAVAGCGGDGDDGTAASDPNQPSGQASNGSGNGQESDGGETGSQSAGDGSQGDGSQSGSSSQFIKEADAICEKARQQTSREFEEFAEGKQSSLGDESELYGEITTEVIIPRIEERISGIEALDTPAAAEEAKESVIAGFEQLIETAEADPVGFNSVSEDAVIEFQGTLKGQGFKKCNGYLG